MPASWARPRRPRRGRPADRCGFGRHTANKSARGGAGAVGSWPRRRGPPTRPSSRVVGSAESCSCGAQACSMHVTACMHVTPFLNMCIKAQEGTRSGAGALSLLHSFPDARRRARALSFLFSPSPLCPVRSDRRDSGPNPGRHPLNPVSPEKKITGKCHECVPVCVCATVCVSAWIGS